jgi:hypothetical protein
MWWPIPSGSGSWNWRCWTEQPQIKFDKQTTGSPLPRGPGIARIYISVGIEQHDGAQSQVSSCGVLSGTSETPCMAIGFWDGGVASGTIAGAVTFGLE